ncbi:pentapeptide repeat-containing protein [Streptomyces sp. NRRL F-5135]|uniref:pentapeptide repeat-containing protein n=1 Tax=Streptomyces sp. NRRL F-5135 TaxID=1463858 RepID=UPI00068B1A36|nr:pentapeptide repeat-containing protein [Streptomyces sp. NRRL F-5135]
MNTAAALGTLVVIVFTWLSIQQVNSEHALTREGQVTDRYNAAVEDIGEDSQEIRLNGIYALQRIMEDSPRDQPSIINVLSAYIRNHAKEPKRDTVISDGWDLPSDIQAALTALGYRNPHFDGNAVIDLHGAYLRGAYLPSANLHGANLRDTDLSLAFLNRANFGGASLASADLGGALLFRADLRGASLYFADVSPADLRSANLARADLSLANLASTDLGGANLTGADLRGADLRSAKLHGAKLGDAKR